MRLLMGPAAGHLVEMAGHHLVAIIHEVSAGAVVRLVVRLIRELRIDRAR